MLESAYMLEEERRPFSLCHGSSFHCFSNKRCQVVSVEMENSQALWSCQEMTAGIKSYELPHNLTGACGGGKHFTEQVWARFDLISPSSHHLSGALNHPCPKHRYLWPEDAYQDSTRLTFTTYPGNELGKQLFGTVSPLPGYWLHHSRIPPYYFKAFCQQTHFKPRCIKQFYVLLVWEMFKALLLSSGFWEVSGGSLTRTFWGHFPDTFSYVASGFLIVPLLRDLNRHRPWGSPLGPVKWTPGECLYSLPHIIPLTTPYPGEPPAQTPNKSHPSPRGARSEPWGTSDVHRCLWSCRNTLGSDPHYNPRASLKGCCRLWHLHKTEQQPHQRVSEATRKPTLKIQGVLGRS